MRKTFSILVCLIALSSAGISAQQGQAPRATAPAAAQGTTPAPPAASSVDPGRDLSDANITIELTVVDKPAGSMTTATRQGAITVANQSSGSVRGMNAVVYTQGTQPKLDPLGLDIDARTWLRKSGMVSVSLTIAYIPTGADPISTSVQRQSATLFLKPGQETQVLTTGSMTGAGPAVRITAKAIVVK